MTLSVTKNGADLPGGTLTNQADVQVGETVEFTCSAKIGSDNTTTVRWKRTSEIGTSDSLITYNPPVGSYSDGNPIYHPNDCTYSRDATMTYNVISFDAKRANNLAFECYVTVVPPGLAAYEVASHAFYINPGKYLCTINILSLFLLISHFQLCLLMGHQVQHTIKLTSLEVHLPTKQMSKLERQWNLHVQLK